MFIFHGGDNSAASPEAMQEHMGKWMTWIDKLAKAGTYNEGKEIVGGFFIINANDMNEAVEISKDCPSFEVGGSVQVRQVMKK